MKYTLENQKQQPEVLVIKKKKKKTIFYTLKSETNRQKSESLKNVKYAISQVNHASKYKVPWLLFLIHKQVNREQN